MIEVDGVGKTYGSTRAVDDVTFTVPDGVVTGFLGPNGSGKSTTMRRMLELDHGPGTTRYDGRQITEVDSVTRTVGAHLDAKYFHPSRSARNHLRMLATEAGVGPGRVDEVLELLGLQSVADQAPKGFSLGMGQRLGLAGAILAEPQHLMLDEPANGLDPQSIHWLRDFLKGYAAQGHAVFVSSHLLSEMQLMADHLVVIAEGRLVADEPMSTFVARSSGNDILIRTDVERVAELTTALQRAGGSVTPEGSDGLAVTGIDVEAVGRTAFDAGVPVLELTGRRASLEEAFLELVQDKQGFATGGGPA